jgi:hypothetical protein
MNRETATMKLAIATANHRLACAQQRLAKTAVKRRVWMSVMWQLHSDIIGLSSI